MNKYIQLLYCKEIAKKNLYGTELLYATSLRTLAFSPKQK